MKFPNIPTDKLGQWKYPKQVVRVPGNNITMQGIDHPNIGIADTGEKKLMMPGQDYHFPNAKSVVEVPVLKAQKGVVNLPEATVQDPKLKAYQSYKDSLDLYNQSMRHLYSGDTFRNLPGRDDTDAEVDQYGRENYEHLMKGDSKWNFSNVWAGDKLDPKDFWQFEVPFTFTETFPSSLFDRYSPSDSKFRERIIGDPENIPITIGERKTTPGELQKDKIKPKSIVTWWDSPNRKDVFVPIYEKPKNPITLEGQKPLEVFDPMGFEAKTGETADNLFEFFKMKGHRSKDIKGHIEGAKKAYGLDSGSAEDNTKLLKLLKGNLPIRAQYGYAQNGIVNEGDKNTRTTWHSKTSDNFRIYRTSDTDGNMIYNLQIPTYFDEGGWQNTAAKITKEQFEEWLPLKKEQFDSVATDHIQRHQMQMQQSKKKGQYGYAQFGYEKVKGGKSATDAELLGIPMPSSAQESSIYRLGRLYEGGVKNWSEQTATGVPSKGAAADAQVLKQFPSLDLTQPVNAQRFVYGQHTGTGAKWRRPDWRFHQEQELMKLNMASLDPAQYEGKYIQPWQSQDMLKQDALKKTRETMSTQIDPILNSAYHEIGMSPDMRSMLIGNTSINHNPQDVVREYNYAVDYEGADKYKLGAKDESDYYTSYYQNVRGMSKEDASAKAKEHINKAAKRISDADAFKKKGGKRETYKYGGAKKGTVVEVEGNEIGVSLEKDGNFKKMWQTPASTPSHEQGGKDVVLPDDKLSMIFPQKYLGVINDALRRGDNEAIARYGKQMKAESEMAGAMGLPFSNPPKAQYGFTFGVPTEKTFDPQRPGQQHVKKFVTGAGYSFPKSPFGVEGTFFNRFENMETGQHEVGVSVLEGKGTVKPNRNVEYKAGAEFPIITARGNTFAVQPMGTFETKRKFPFGLAGSLGVKTNFGLMDKNRTALKLGGSWRPNENTEIEGEIDISPEAFKGFEQPMYRLMARHTMGRKKKEQPNPKYAAKAQYGVVNKPNVKLIKKGKKDVWLNEEKTDFGNEPDTYEAIQSLPTYTHTARQFQRDNTLSDFDKAFGKGTRAAYKYVGEPILETLGTTGAAMGEAVKALDYASTSDFTWEHRMTEEEKAAATPSFWNILPQYLGGTGKQTSVSEQIGVGGVGGFALDVLTDPATYVGGGLLGKAAKKKANRIIDEATGDKKALEAFTNMSSEEYAKALAKEKEYRIMSPEKQKELYDKSVTDVFSSRNKERMKKHLEDSGALEGKNFTAEDVITTMKSRAKEENFVPGSGYLSQPIHPGMKPAVTTEGGWGPHIKHIYGFYKAGNPYVKEQTYKTTEDLLKDVNVYGKMKEIDRNVHLNPTIPNVQKPGTMQHEVGHLITRGAERMTSKDQFMKKALANDLKIGEVKYKGGGTPAHQQAIHEANEYWKEKFNKDIFYTPDEMWNKLPESTRKKIEGKTKDKIIYKIAGRDSPHGKKNYIDYMNYQTQSADEWRTWWDGIKKDMVDTDWIGKKTRKEYKNDPDMYGITDDWTEDVTVADVKNYLKFKAKEGDKMYLSRIKDLNAFVKHMNEIGYISAGAVGTAALNQKDK